MGRKQLAGRSSHDRPRSSEVRASNRTSQATGRITGLRQVGHRHLELDQRTCNLHQRRLGCLGLPLWLPSVSVQRRSRMTIKRVATSMFFSLEHRRCKNCFSKTRDRLLRGLPREPPPQQLRRKVSFIRHDVFSSCSLALQKFRSSKNHAGRKLLKSIVKKVGPTKSRPEKVVTRIVRCRNLVPCVTVSNDEKIAAHLDLLTDANGFNPMSSSIHWS